MDHLGPAVVQFTAIFPRKKSDRLLSATDSNGTGTATLTLQVRSLSPPSIAITSPASGADFTTPATVSIAAQASDPDGTVVKVEFFANGTPLGEDTAAPFVVEWDRPDAGEYTLTARATDNDGATTTSAPVRVTVRPPPSAPRVVATTPVAGTPMVARKNPIMVHFNQPMKVTSLGSGSFRVVGSASGTHAGKVSWEGGVYSHWVAFSPDVEFLPDELVTAIVSGEVESLEGKHLGTDYSFSFRTLGSPSIVAVKGSLTEDTVWHSGRVYLVQSDGLYVPAGRTLTIEPGVVVKFESGGTGLGPRVNLVVDGHLNLLSTPSQKVVFTSSWDDSYGGDTNGDGDATRPAAGDWGGIRYGNPNNVLHDVVLRYGGWDYGAVGMVSLTANDPNGFFLVRDCLLERAQSRGIYLPNPGRSTVRNTTFVDVPYPVYLESNNADWSGLEFSGRTLRAIAVGGGLQQDILWRAGQTYCVADTLWIPAGRTLTIEPGVVVKFESRRTGPGEKVNLEVYGHLNLLSTPGQKVVFTSSWDDSYGGDTNGDGDATRPAAGDWGGLIFTNPNNVLHDAVLRYGGGSVGRALLSVSGAPGTVFEVRDSLLELSRKGLDTDHPSSVIQVTDSVFRNIGTYGIEVLRGSIHIRGSSFEQVGIAAVHVGNGATAVIAQCNMVDPERDHGVLNDGSTPVLATGNWWGDPTGPSTVGPGKGVKVSANVLYEPWATAPVAPAGSGKVRIVSVPNPHAVAGLPYRYDADNRALASGGGTIRWEKLFGPPSFAISRDTGEVSWVPTDTGRFAIGISATDGTNSDAQLFVVTVDRAVDAGAPQVTGFRWSFSGAGPLLDAALEVTFSEPVLVDGNDIAVIDRGGRDAGFDGYSYTVSGNRLVVQASGLSVGEQYRLILADTITDYAFNPLDGEFDGRTFPSGNGLAGGRFIAHFAAVDELRFDGVAKVSDRQVRLILTLLPGTRVRIEASDDLIHWTKVYSATATSGTVEWTDPTLGELDRRFYRAVRE